MEGDTSVQEIPGGFLDDLIEVLVYQEISDEDAEEKVQKMFPH